MKWLIIFLIIATAIYADPVDDLENKYVDVLTKYKVEYDAKCRRLSLVYIKQLEKLQIATVKKGDLDGALKIKAKIAEIKKILKTNLPTPKANTDSNSVDVSIKPKAVNKVVNSIVDMWRSNNRKGPQYTLNFRVDHTVIHTNNVNARFDAGTWKIEGNLLTINWNRQNHKVSIYIIKPGSLIDQNNYIFKKQNPIIGAWQSINKGLVIIYIFKADGTVSHIDKATNLTSEGKYTIKGNNLRTYQANGNSNTWRIEKDSIVGIDNKFIFKKQNTLIGNWQQDHKYKTVLQLHADKSAKYGKRNKGTWKATNGILTVTWSHGPIETYKITNTKLTALKTTAVGKLYDYNKIQ